MDYDLIRDEAYLDQAWAGVRDWINESDVTKLLQLTDMLVQDDTSLFISWLSKQQPHTIDAVQRLSLLACQEAASRSLKSP